MPKYIKLDDLVLEYSGLAKIAPNDFVGIARYFAEQIKAKPTADVRENVRGRWIGSECRDEFMTCSKCGSEFEWYSIGGVSNLYAFNFCPNCGAKMGGGVE